MARLMLVAPDFFFQFVQWPAQPGNLVTLLDRWIDNVRPLVVSVR
jgi:hypothetical protein